jgi:aspartyl-tRNA(Asn)/glutamyl-tRNA(Gln) amidotransferase subunit A
MEAITFHAPLLAEHFDDYGPFCRSRMIRAMMYGPGDFTRAQQARHAIRQRWNAIFEQIDVISTPTQPDVAPPLGETGWVTFTNPFNAMGWPAISVPCGLGSSDLPLGIQFAGKPWDDATVLRAARAVEMAKLI